jgi:putative acetyltransferase
MEFEIRVDDLTGEPTQRLVRAHLAGVHELSPPESVHALDLDGLRGDGLTVWSAWRDGELVGIGALKRLDDGTGEIKSMRVDDRFRGTGAGRALLRHIVDEARARGIRTLFLETGAEEAFVPARRLYASEGFTACAPFASYRPDPLSVFMRRDLIA